MTSLPLRETRESRDSDWKSNKSRVSRIISIGSLSSEPSDKRRDSRCILEGFAGARLGIVKSRPSSVRQVSREMSSSERTCEEGISLCHEKIQVAQVNVILRNFKADGSCFHNSWWRLLTVAVADIHATLRVGERFTSRA